MLKPELAAVPIINIRPLVRADPPLAECEDLSDLDGMARATARRILLATRDIGFFHVVGHGVDLTLQQMLLLGMRGKLATDLEEAGRLELDPGRFIATPGTPFDAQTAAFHHNYDSRTPHPMWPVDAADDYTLVVEE